MVTPLRKNKFAIYLCLILLLTFALSACSSPQNSQPIDDQPTAAENPPAQDLPSSTEEFNPNDANAVLAAVLKSPLITCLGKTRLEMEAAFGPISGSEWLDGMLYYHESYPGMVSYTNADIDYAVKENDTCIVVNILLREVVPEIVGKSLEVDPGIWGENQLSDLTGTYQYEIPIENGFMLITSDEKGNIDLNSVIFAKLGE